MAEYELYTNGTRWKVVWKGRFLGEDFLYFNTEFLARAFIEEKKQRETAKWTRVDTSVGGER